FFPEPEPNIAQTVLDKLMRQRSISPSLTTLLKKNESLFDEDTLFAKQLKENQNILAIGFLPRFATYNTLPSPLFILTPEDKQELEIIRGQGYISNIPVLQQAATGAGFINIFADSDGIIRRAPLVMQYNGKIYASLSLQAALMFLGEKINLVTPFYGKTKKLESLQIGNANIPTDAKGQVLIPFVGKSYTFPYYSAINILQGKFPSQALLGKIIFIGTSATGAGDLQATSIDSPFPGVEIQATLVNGILQNNFSYHPPWILGANLVITIVLGLISAFLFPHLGPRTLGAIVILSPPTLIVIDDWIWTQTGLILSILMPSLLILAIGILNIIYGYLFETRRREHLRQMFGQYVPEKHIDEMLRTTSDYGLRGEDRDMTVLFADIRNFTSISENLKASELVDMLNTFFNPMTEIIFHHHGTIDKYVGDLIMAFWGAPLSDPDHAQHALEAAFAMQEKLIQLQKVLKEHKWPNIKIGIGINSGIMSVGDMGSRFRRNYTVLGDAVNLASRVEALTKFYGVDIIATENTVQNQTKFIFRQLDRVMVKGKMKSIAIYELIGMNSELTPELTQELALYHQGLQHYFAQEWAAAEKCMQELNQTYPKKKIYHIYLDRIATCKEQHLPPDWDGIYIHATK
ncbi:MAG: adenylate/guanylate cyclase domain-containing protein, partial [Gammaproteobacteria bacterium]